MSIDAIENIKKYLTKTNRYGNIRSKYLYKEFEENNLINCVGKYFMDTFMEIVISEILFLRK